MFCLLLHTDADVLTGPVHQQLLQSFSRHFRPAVGSLQSFILLSAEELLVARVEEEDAFAFMKIALYCCCPRCHERSKRASFTFPSRRIQRPSVGSCQEERFSC